MHSSRPRPNLQNTPKCKRLYVRSRTLRHRAHPQKGTSEGMTELQQSIGGKGSAAGSSSARKHTNLVPHKRRSDTRGCRRSQERTWRQLSRRAKTALVACMHGTCVARESCSRLRLRGARRQRIGLHRSTSPKTMSCVPMMATTSASMWPLAMKSRPPKCEKPGARILQRYGRLVPSETR